MIMIFRNTQEAQKYGKSANEEQLRKIMKTKAIYQATFDHRMAGPPRTSEEFDKLFEISTNIQFCNECLAEASVESL